MWLEGEGGEAAEALMQRRIRTSGRTTSADRPWPVTGELMNEPSIPASQSEVDLADAAEPRSVRELLLRAVNLVVALVALIVLAPVMLLIAIAIKVDSRGPIFYRQLRIGLDRRRAPDAAEGENKRTADLGGRPFVIYKFRTMLVDAEADTGPVWTRGADDRVTRVGRFLRHHRLDELPQLWNVVTGDMAVVGPRPERPGFVHDLTQEIEGYPLRQRVRPGITGLAQVNREADQSIDDVRRKLQYDLDYVRRRSLLLDLSVMIRTPLVMIRRDVVASEDGTESGERPESR